MLNYIQQRRSLYTGLMCSVLILLLARPMVNLLFSTPVRNMAAPAQAAPPVVRASMPVHSAAHAHRTIARLAPTTAPLPATAKGVVSVEGIDASGNGLDLESILKPYDLKFHGRMTCDGAPCAGQVEIAIEATHNSDVHQTAPVAPDGSFSFTLPIRELEREQVDWRLTGRSNVMMPVEARGRLILSDEPALSIERTLALQG